MTREHTNDDDHGLLKFSLYSQHRPPTRCSMKPLIAPIVMLHLVYGRNFPLIFVSLVRYSLLHFHTRQFIIFTIFAMALESSLTRSVFHSELEAWLFGKSFPL